MTALTFLLCIWFALCIVSAEDQCSNTSIAASCQNLPSSPNQYIACRAVNNLQSLFYDPLLKQWKDDGGWWNCANTIESLINYCSLSNLCDSKLISVIHEVTDAQTMRIKGGYDDIQWWSLAMIRLYEFNGDQTYLERAVRFFDYVWENAWDTTTCGGGLWWDVAKTYKNAITNELAMMNTAKLYNITQNATYKMQFDLLWNWFYADGNDGKGMLNKQWLINDGLNVNTVNPSDCDNNEEVEWSYNQGVILGGLSKMYLIDNYNESLLNISWNIIHSVMEHLVTPTDGILHEQVTDKNVEQSSDASQFKGIFMRYLMYWYQNVIATDASNTYRDFKEQIITFVNNQLDGIYDNCMNPNCFAEFSAVWNASWIDTDSATVAQVAAIDAYNWAFVL